MNGYRPLSQVLTAYRPCKNPAVCSSFVLDLTPAVGAVDIPASFTDGLSSLSVYPSARTTPRHLASDYIHPYKDAEDIPRIAAYGSTSPMIRATLPW